jgi:excisionase family DNA binding protein
MTDKPFTVATLADRWQCSSAAIYWLIREKRLPAFRLGGKLLRIRAEDVASWENTGGSIALADTALASSKGKPSSAGRTKKASLTAEDLASSLLK